MDTFKKKSSLYMCWHQNPRYITRWSIRDTIIILYIQYIDILWGEKFSTENYVEYYLLCVSLNKYNFTLKMHTLFFQGFLLIPGS